MSAVPPILKRTAMHQQMETTVYMSSQAEEFVIEQRQADGRSLYIKVLPENMEKPARTIRQVHQLWKDTGV